MPGLRDIKRRIHSVRKTQQITRAMRMVAAAKLRRAQEAILSARPYAERLREALGEVARSQRGAEHPLLAVREPVRFLELVVVTSDRGLCGAFNANVLRRAAQIRAARAPGVERLALTLVGRKGADYFRRRAAEITRTYRGIGAVAYQHAEEIARPLMERYAEGQVDEVLLVHGEFRSAMSQVPREARLLPLAPPSPEEAPPGAPFTVEPSAAELLAVIVPRAVEFEVYRALLDNQASEHAARMTAMEAATRNTEEMIERLTLQFNRARQAAITKELVEIVTGAEALHG